MGDPSKSPTANFYGILGIPKSASLTDICKAYKFMVLKWHPDRNPNNKAEAESKFTSINEAYRVLSFNKREEVKVEQEPKTPKKKKSSEKASNNDDDDEGEETELHISSPTLLSRTTSRISPMAIPPLPNTSWRSTSTSGPNTPSSVPGTPTGPTILSKTASQRSPTPIFFSQSAARRKPPPIEKKLACSLEELCQGCVKKIKITRNAISSEGLIVQEEEILMIKIKPGWKKGTKITFEGKGDERPGTLPADIIFAIDEKRHPLYKREGDDLELGVEVPLVQALTRCTISVPLLVGGDITMSIDDIIYPGYEKIIPGQGMPKPKEVSQRGNLRLKFSVEFPHELSDEQRTEVVSILEGCS